MMWSPPADPLSGRLPPNTSMPESFGTSPGVGRMYFAMSRKLSSSRVRRLTRVVASVSMGERVSAAVIVEGSYEEHD
jgi:hypothetical protein